MNDEVVFGDICTRIKETDVEDIFKNRTAHTDEEFDNLEAIVKDLVSHTYNNRSDYDKISKKCVNKRSRYLNKQGKILHKYPSKVDLNIAYRKMIKAGIIEPNISLEPFMKRKFGRSGSGELPVTVFTSPSKFDCPEDCFYCPDEKVEVEVWNKKKTRKFKKKKRIQPRSYLSTEPGCMRAAKDKFHPVLQQ